MRDATGDKAVFAEEEDFVPREEPCWDIDLPFVVEEEKLGRLE